MLVFVGLIILITIILLLYFIKNKRYYELIGKIPGPSSRYFLLGNLDILWSYRNLPTAQRFYNGILALTVLYRKHGIFKWRIGPKYTVVVYDSKTVKNLLSSNTNINKSSEYDFLYNWLRNGLLISNGNIWKAKRKLLTPAFHLKILEDFIPIINKNANILINKLSNAIDKQHIDIREVITPCTLDIICETSMGISIESQLNRNQDYMKALHDLSVIFMARLLSPWLWPNFIFHLTKYGKVFMSSVTTLQNFTNKVIHERKGILMKEMSQSKPSDEKNNDQVLYLSSNSKNRLAFLDLLLEKHMANNSLTLDDIREQVDTFMFAGHDTTSVSLSFTLYIIGLHPSVQIKIQDELDSIFVNNRTRDITRDDIRKMCYIDCVIKESLRLFPPVPIVSRVTSEEFEIGEYVIPIGTTFFINVMSLHLDPNEFEDPVKFRPERFSKEYNENKNIYNYAPFSAGPRNCIGQKFALLEEKIILAKIFLNYNVVSIDHRDKLELTNEIVLSSIGPIKMKITQRI